MNSTPAVSIPGYIAGAGGGKECGSGRTDEDTQLRDAEEGRSHQDMLACIPFLCLPLGLVYPWVSEPRMSQGFGFRQTRS